MYMTIDFLANWLVFPHRVIYNVDDFKKFAPLERNSKE